MTSKYSFRLDGRQFYCGRFRADQILVSPPPGNPFLWFSWEAKEDGTREVLAQGVDTLHEAVGSIERIGGDIQWPKESYAGRGPYIHPKGTT